jgi:hypothetical protein
MEKVFIIIIAASALLMYVVGLLMAFKVAGKADPIATEAFNKSYWSHVLTSVNSLLILNLSTLLGLPAELSKSSINVQQTVAVAYLVLLLFIFIYWGLRKKFEEGNRMPVVIPQLSKSFFALMLAALGLILKSSA